MKIMRMFLQAVMALSIVFSFPALAQLSPAQLATLKTSINNDPAFSSLPLTSGAAQTIATAYNLAASPTVTVWRSTLATDVLIDTIDYIQYTPSDAVPTTVNDQTGLIYMNRTQLVLIKQNNLAMLVTGRESVNCSKANVRAALRDATIQLPTGAAGAARSASGANAVTLLTACTRPATRAEALYATVDAQTGGVTAKVLVFEGMMTSELVQVARELP